MHLCIMFIVGPDLRLSVPKLWIRLPLHGSIYAFRGGCISGLASPIPSVKLAPARFRLHYFVQKTTATILKVKVKKWRRQQASVLICRTENFQIIFRLFDFQCFSVCIVIMLASFSFTSLCSKFFGMSIVCSFRQTWCKRNEATKAKGSEKKIWV